jgi:transcriptional regulator, XRE family
MNRLKEIRLAQNMAQNVLAEQVGITRMTLSRYEKSEFLPSVDIALRLARILGVKVQDIWSEEEGELRMK